MARSPLWRRSVAPLAAFALLLPAVLTFSRAAYAQPAGDASAGKGRLVVKEKSGKPVRVTIDGVDMGDAPWSGEVAEGAHDVALRGQGLTSAPQKVSVEKGKTQEIELTAASSSTSIKVGTSDAKGLIYLDGKLVGEGSYVGELPAGTHKLKITRDGYDPFEEDITLKENEPYSRTITLKLSSRIETGPVQNIERLEGLYGGFTLLAMFTPGGTGNTIEKQCENKPPELGSCEAGSGFGPGVGGFIGYHWDPVGIELFVGGQFDQRTMKNDWNASSTDLGIGPDPARVEDYTLSRVGGVGLARIRVSHQWEKIRLSMAAGAGFSYRVMVLERDTTAKDNSGAIDKYASEALSYLSPAVGLEPSVMYRLSPGIAVSAGLQIFFDAPSTSIFGGENPKTPAEANHALRVPNATPPQLKGTVSTPPYELASNMQVFIGPYLGMMFGP
jgi:hypothetical protein